MGLMARLVLAVCVVSSVVFRSCAQTCTTYSFSSNTTFATCLDLPYQSAFLHWTYDQATGKLEMAYRHGGISSSANSWVAWGINPNNNLNTAMPGAQALVALSPSGGAATAYTTSIGSNVVGTTLQEGAIRYNVTGLSTTRENDEIIIFATVTLPAGTTSLVHLWQTGPLSGSSPQQHSLNTENIDAKEMLNLVSGQTQAGASGNTLRRRRNVHGVLNAVSWGIMLPMGAIIARYLKVFKSADPAWFYLHVTCQASAYIVGVAGWGLGLKIGSDSVGIQYTTHRTLGIIIFCLATLQVFALFLRPNKDHKYRMYWNMYHYLVGYATIIISIVNIFQGFDALQDFVGDRYDDWKNAYIGIIAALGGIAVLLEVYTWIVVLKRRESSESQGNARNGVSAVYDSKTQQV